MTTRGLQHKIVLNTEQLRKKSLSLFNIQSPFFLSELKTRKTQVLAEKGGNLKGPESSNSQYKSTG